jgi:hypothetical protein
MRHLENQAGNGGSDSPAVGVPGGAGGAGGAAVTWRRSPRPAPARQRITIPATIALAAIGLAATSGCSTSSRAAAGPAGPLPCPTRYIAAKPGLAQGTPTATYLVIYPPNQTTPIPVAYTSPTCAHTSPTCAKPVEILTVDAVRPGSGG